MTFTPRQVANAINAVRIQTDWREYSLIVDTAALILAGPDASDEEIKDAKDTIKKTM